MRQTRDDSLDYRLVLRYVSMTERGLTAATTTWSKYFLRRLNIATRVIGMTDVLSPSQVRTFSDCEVRWFYEHLLGLRDPPTAILALDKAVRMSLMANFRQMGSHWPWEGLRRAPVTTRIPMWSKQLELWKRLAPVNHASNAAAGKPVDPCRA